MRVAGTLCWVGSAMGGKYRGKYCELDVYHAELYESQEE
jgi:hypothetical protein